MSDNVVSISLPNVVTVTLIVWIGFMIIGFGLGAFKRFSGVSA